MKNWSIAILFGFFVTSLVFGIGEKLKSDAWKKYSLDNDRARREIIALDLCKLEKVE